MSASEEIRRLESELETNRQNLREDAVQIQHKIAETKAELSPTNLVRRWTFAALGAALIAGFAVGYFLELRKAPQQLAEPVLEHVGKPAARSIITTAGRQLATNAIRERYQGRADRAGRIRRQPELA